MSGFVRMAAGLYSRLLLLCPGELRSEFGEEMTLVFADDLADSLARDGRVAALRVCFRAAVELAPLAVANALSIHGVVTALIASVLTMICFAAELAVARAHGPTAISMAPMYVSVVLVLIPSAAAALVAFLAARVALRSTPQRFLH